MSVIRSKWWWNSAEGEGRPQMAFSPIDEKAARMRYAEYRDRVGLPKISKGLIFAPSLKEFKRLIAASLQPSLF